MTRRQLLRLTPVVLYDMPMTNNTEPESFAHPDPYALHSIEHDCEDCMDYAMAENMHQDEDHEGDSMPNPHCRVCRHDIPNPLSSRKGSTRIVRSRIDHRPCYVAGTHAEGREACRRAGGPNV